MSLVMRRTADSGKPVDLCFRMRWARVEEQGRVLGDLRGGISLSRGQQHSDGDRFLFNMMLIIILGGF